MAERQVKVSLIAQVNGYIAGMQAAAKATRETGTAAEKLAQQREAFTALGAAGALAGGAIAVGLAVAVRKFAEFDEAMSQVQAATQETSANMDRLRDAALDAGARTVFSATEAANAIEELGKAGVSTEDILSGGLDGALDLAAAGGLGVAEAAGIAATALKTFNLDGEDMAHVADLMAAGAGKAMGDVTDLGQALGNVGLQAANTGLTIEETTGFLAAFASYGKIGGDAGTAFKSMLQALSAPSAEASRKMDELGISAYDAQGNFVGLEKLAGNLQTAMKDLTPEARDAANTIIFGSYGVQAATALYNEGADGIKKWTAEVSDSGYASRVAADRLDNLSGDVEKLGGAFDTALIKSGSAANDVLRQMVQTATFLVDGFGELPEPVINTGVAVGTVAGSIALATAAASLGIPKYAEYQKALRTLGITGRTAAIGIGASTAALSAAVLVLGAIAADAADRKQTIESFADSLDQATGSVTNYTRELVAQRLQTEGAVDAAAKYGIGVEELVDLTLMGSDAASKWADARRTANAEDAAAIAQFDLISSGVEVVAKQVESGADAWKLNQDATESARKATEDNERTLAALRGEAYDAGGQIDSLTEQIRNFATGTLDSREAQRQFQDAIDQATESVAANGATLDVNTDAGRQNEASLDAIAKRALEVASATYEQTGSQDEATAAIHAGRTALIEQLAQYGITGAEAEGYANKLGLIPGNIDTTVNLDTSGASARLANFVAELQASGLYGTGASLTIPAGLYGYASGGYTGDIPATQVAGVVHGREFVSAATTVANPENRAALEYMNAGGDISRYATSYGVPNYAIPQYVTAESSTQAVSNVRGVVELGPASLKTIRDTTRSEIAAYLQSTPQEVAGFANRGNSRKAARGARN
ncbi:TP901 family phage tail tape measure protein [Leifsonia sp. AK011]|uniref:phage tail tape measure protein n=1 Tax=Leifsonia sp. AK011 TaxID=2723075 RepID=UPI0015CA935B|nr:phage tail tape measure protein [Leifsonia sp. AK011]NYF10814.1 TP901 family phage tail tape measure protein [Leifsonia sp. AK011]